MIIHRTNFSENPHLKVEEAEKGICDNCGREGLRETDFVEKQSKRQFVCKECANVETFQDNGNRHFIYL